jgi:hypothetical protein
MCYCHLLTVLPLNNPFYSVKTLKIDEIYFQLAVKVPKKSEPVKKLIL